MLGDAWGSVAAAAAGPRPTATALTDRPAAVLGLSADLQAEAIGPALGVVHIPRPRPLPSPAAGASLGLRQ